MELGSKIIKLNEKVIKIQIWNTSEQESFYTISNTYYKDAICAILVYDITRRQTFINIEKWLETIRKFNHKNINILLLGNKKDLEYKRQVSYEEGDSFAKKNGLIFLEASAKNTKSVNEIFNLSIQCILNNIKEKKEIFIIKEEKNQQKIEYLERKEKNEKERVIELEKINEDLYLRINQLENMLNEEKSRNEVLNQKIIELKQLLNYDDQRINKDEKIIEKLKYDINENDNMKIMELMTKLNKKENELELFKSKLPFEILPGEKLMSVIFNSVDKKIHYSIICKNTDIFTRLENELYNEGKYKEYRNYNNYFIANGRKINKLYTLEQNGIKNSDIITLIHEEE